MRIHPFILLHVALNVDQEMNSTVTPKSYGMMPRKLGAVTKRDLVANFVHAVESLVFRVLMVRNVFILQAVVPLIAWEYVNITVTPERYGITQR